MKKSFHVAGLAELEKALQQLPQELVGKNGGPVRAALRSAAKPMLTHAHANMPEDTGRLKRATKMQVHPKPKYLSEIVGVGVDLGRSRDDPKGAWYGYIVEFRTQFLRKAFDANKTGAITTFRTSLAKSIERIAKKIGDENARAVGARIKNL